MSNNSPTPLTVNIDDLIEIVGGLSFTVQPLDQTPVTAPRCPAWPVIRTPFPPPPAPRSSPACGPASRAGSARW